MSIGVLISSPKKIKVKSTQRNSIIVEAVEIAINLQWNKDEIMFYNV